MNLEIGLKHPSIVPTTTLIVTVLLIARISHCISKSTIIGGTGTLEETHNFLGMINILGMMRQSVLLGMMPQKR